MAVRSTRFLMLRTDDFPTYDAAGRLSQVVDSATGLTEAYTWNDDGTLASAPGAGYVKQFEYDEEQHLVRIAHNTSGTVTTAYEYGYAADGGRRWRKDYAGNVWTWYPCGVACNAGELVEQTSTLAGGTWTTSALYLKAGGNCSLVPLRRNNEIHLLNINGMVALVTNMSGNIIANNIYDSFGVEQSIQGSAQTPFKADFQFATSEDLLGIAFQYIPQRGNMPLQQSRQGSPQQVARLAPSPPRGPYSPSDCVSLYNTCITQIGIGVGFCGVVVTIIVGAIGTVCAIACGITGGSGGLTAPACIACLRGIGGTIGGGVGVCAGIFDRGVTKCKKKLDDCTRTGYWPD